MSIDTLKVMNLKNDIRRHTPNMFKGMDGRYYSTPEALARADEEWKRQNLFYIVYDAKLGRREIPVGTGKVNVCFGHFIKIDPITRKRRYVPAYKEETF